MESDLRDALRARYGDDPSPLERKHLDFALSARSRGRAMLDRIERELSIAVDGRAVLDVGCAHAGFVIEAAARGARAWGVEMSPKFWELGRRSAAGEPGEIHLVPGDFCSRRIARVLPDDFELVLINDVFEHVYDTAALLERLHQVMADGAPFVFSIPNADAVELVASEIHYRRPGLTLLPPNWWGAVVPSFTAFYRPWSYYTGLFRAFGFADIRRFGGEPAAPLAETRARILEGLAAAEAAIDGLEVRDRKVEPVLSAGLAEYRGRLRRDLERLDAAALAWKYLTPVWKGCAVKAGPILAEIEAAGAPAGGGPRGHVIALDQPAAALTTPWTRRARALIEPGTDAIRCVVTGTADTSAGQYGGIAVDLDAPASLEIDLELLEPEHIEAVYIDGEDPRRCRVLRWWTEDVAAAAPRQVHALVPGEASAPFLPAGASFAPLASRLHIFVRVRPGARAGFVVRGARATHH